MKSRRKTQLVCYPLKLVKELEHGRWGSMLTMKAKKWEEISWQIAESVNAFQLLTNATDNSMVDVGGILLGR